MLSNQTVDCYGYNLYGQAEDYFGGDAIGLVTGAGHTCILLSSGNVECYGTAYLPAEDYSGADATAVVAGAQHTCALRSDATVACWGRNAEGQSEDWPLALPPTLTLPADLAVTATQANGTAVTYGATAVDHSGVTLTPSCAPASGDLFAPGTTQVTCTATDSGGRSTTGTFSVTVRFEWSGLLQPFQDGAEIKQGRALPLAFQLAGASAGIANLEARLYVAAVSNGVAGAESAAPAKDGADNVFVYEGGRYKFSLDTRALSKGTHQLRVDLGDGALHTATLRLR